MLRTILSITGKPGLFKIVSQGNRNLIVEDMTSKKRLPAGARDRIVSLGDISMYTESGDTPLGEILDRVYAHYDGKPVDIKKLVDTKGLRDAFAAVVADYDRDRVYDSDIKKLFQWYNLLLANGFTKFTKEEADNTIEAEAEAEEAEKE